MLFRVGMSALGRTSKILGFGKHRAAAIPICEFPKPQIYYERPFSDFSGSTFHPARPSCAGAGTCETLQPAPFLHLALARHVFGREAAPASHQVPASGGCCGFVRRCRDFPSCAFQSARSNFPWPIPHFAGAALQ